MARFVYEPTGQILRFVVSIGLIYRRRSQAVTFRTTQRHDPSAKV